MVSEIIELASFFKKTYSEHKDKNAKTRIALLQVRLELRTNAEILGLLGQKYYRERPETWPALLARIQVLSFQSLILAGIHPCELFTGELHREYEYVMRKLMLLRSVAESGNLLLDGLSLPARSRNLTRALRLLLQDNTDDPR